MVEVYHDNIVKFL